MAAHIAHIANMLARFIAIQFPKSRIGQVFNKASNGDKFLYNALSYASCGAVIGATYGACTNREWNQKRDIGTRFEGAACGGMFGAFAGLLYPVTGLVGLAVSLSYLFDCPFEINYKRNDRDA